MDASYFIQVRVLHTEAMRDLARLFGEVFVKPLIDQSQARVIAAYGAQNCGKSTFFDSCLKQIVPNISWGLWGELPVSHGGATVSYRHFDCGHYVYKDEKIPTPMMPHTISNKPVMDFLEHPPLSRIGPGAAIMFTEPSANTHLPYILESIPKFNEQLIDLLPSQKLMQNLFSDWLKAATEVEAALERPGVSKSEPAARSLSAPRKVGFFLTDIESEDAKQAFENFRARVKDHFPKNF